MVQLKNQSPGGAPAIQRYGLALLCVPPPGSLKKN